MSDICFRETLCEQYFLVDANNANATCGDFPPCQKNYSMTNALF